MIQFDPRQPRGIIWLASYPKSGNTWLRMFLYHLNRIRRRLPPEEDELNSATEFIPWEKNFRDLFQQHLQKPLSEATPAEIGHARARVQAAIAGQAAGVIILKTHNALLASDDGAPLINTNVSIGAIYVLRDPRDVTISLARQQEQSLDEAVHLLGTANAYVGDGIGEVWGSWSQNVSSWVDGADESLLVVRYEDMLTKPTETFGAIVAHLRQPATPDQVARAIRFSSFDRLQNKEKKYGFGEGTAGQFFVQGKAGGWRDKLTAAQADAIVAAHGDTMRKFGYLD